MRRRKTLLATAVVVLLVAGGGYFLERRLAQHRAETVARLMRDCVDVGVGESDAAPIPEAGLVIELDFRVVALDRTGDHIQLYSILDDGEPVRGIVREPRRMLELVQKLPGAYIQNAPNLAAMSGQPFFYSVGMKPKSTFWGVRVDGTAAKTKDGRIAVHLDATFTDHLQFLENEEGEPFRCSTATRPLILRSGETGLLGGLTRRNIRTRLAVPWLSQLPVLGDSLRFTRTTEIDEELLILVRASWAEQEGAARPPTPVGAVPPRK